MAVLALLAPLACLAQSSSPQISQAAAWPRTYDGPDGKVTMYQPQVESWNQVQLQGRAAVQVMDAGKTQPSYGVVWFTSKTEILKDRRLVLLYQTTFTRSQFPGSRDGGDAYRQILQTNLGNANSLVSLDQLQASLTANGSPPSTRTVQVQNSVPGIIFSTSPAMLILVYGDPVLRPVEGTPLERVMNTPALMLVDPSSGLYYFYLTDRWMQASALGGPWNPAVNPPATLAGALQAATATRSADLFQDPSPGLKAALQSGPLPTVYVATTPTELVVTTGAPTLQQIPGTSLQWVSNTRSDLFLGTRTGTYYLLLSGRWFVSTSLSGGWSYLPATKLPGDFSRIPPDHSRAAVLVSVPGTPEAKEAVIANAIPQTATITPSGVSFTATYGGGAPDFRPIEGTPLQYAVNSSAPVIRLSSSSFYAVDSGVWFCAPGAAGPWTVATDVPPEIYQIPPTCPIYNVTYVRVYSATPDTVVVGYTPGYYGTMIGMDDTLVYGTGYSYPAWVGTDLVVAPPVTYGMGAAYAWGAASGFMLGAATSAFWGPGWGWGWGGRYNVTNNWNVNHNWNNWSGRGAWSTSSSAYGRWGNAAYAGTRASWSDPVTGNTGQGYRGADYNTRTGDYTRSAGFTNTGAAGRTTDGIHGTTCNPSTGQVNSWGAAKSGNNVYAGRDGQVYRDDGGQGWQKFSGGGWQNTDRSAASDFNRNSWAGQESVARDSGFNRANAFHASGSWGGSGFGGGFRGGSFGMGGFRGGGFRGGFRR